MMSEVLALDEAVSAAHSFLHTIYGEDVMTRWTNIKVKLGFNSEREFMTWLLDLASQMSYSVDEGAIASIAVTGLNDDPQLHQHHSDDYSDAASQQCYYEDQSADDKNIDGISDECVMTVESNRSSLMATSELNVSTVLPSSSSSSQPNHDDRRFICPHCPYRARTRQHLSYHLAARHTEGEKPYQCHYCNYQASVEKTLKAHLIYKHGYSSKHVCEWCCRCFPYHQNLIVHQTKCQKSSTTSSSSTPPQNNDVAESKFSGIT